MRARPRRTRTSWPVPWPSASATVSNGDKVACTTKGPVPVLIAVKAIAIANTYLADDGKQIKFTVSICDLEKNPEIRSDTVTSTYLHFALSAR